MHRAVRVSVEAQLDFFHISNSFEVDLNRLGDLFGARGVDTGDTTVVSVQGLLCELSLSSLAVLNDLLVQRHCPARDAPVLALFSELGIGEGCPHGDLVVMFVQYDGVMAELLRNLQKNIEFADFLALQNEDVPLVDLLYDGGINNP